MAEGEAHWAAKRAELPAAARPPVRCIHMRSSSSRLRHTTRSSASTPTHASSPITSITSTTSPSTTSPSSSLRARPRRAPIPRGARPPRRRRRSGREHLRRCRPRCPAVATPTRHAQPPEELPTSRLRVSSPSRPQTRSWAFGAPMRATRHAIHTGGSRRGELRPMIGQEGPPPRSHRRQLTTIDQLLPTRTATTTITLPITSCRRLGERPRAGGPPRKTPTRS